MACTTDPNCKGGGGGTCRCCPGQQEACCKAPYTLHVTVTIQPVPNTGQAQTVNGTLTWDAANCVWRGDVTFANAFGCNCVIAICLSCCTAPFNACTNFKVGTSLEPTFCCGLCGSAACSISACQCNPLIVDFGCTSFNCGGATCQFSGEITQ